MKYKHFPVLLVGILSMLFPIALILSEIIQNGSVKNIISISGFYHSDSRAIYLGFLIASGILLLFFSSLDVKINTLARFAGLFELISALFPTKNRLNTYAFSESSTIIHSNFIHIVFAVLFFLSITYITSRFYSEKKPGTNRLLIISMVISMVIVAIDFLFHRLLPDFLKPYSFKLIFEIIWLNCFGVSWLCFFRKLLQKDSQIVNKKPIS